MSTGKNPVTTPDSDPSPRERSPGEPKELCENKQPSFPIIWVDRDKPPAPSPTSRTRGVIAIALTLATSLILIVTSVAFAFFGLPVQKFLIINGAAVATLAFTPVISWYFGPKGQGGRRRRR